MRAFEPIEALRISDKKERKIKVPEEQHLNEELRFAVVENITPVGKGTRVCIDTADILTPTEGVLAGNTGHGYLLILSENRASAAYPPRTFRINAGGVHQYLFQQDHTRYLEEIRGGETLTIYNGTEPKEVPVGRVKMEKRELVRVETNWHGERISATVQQADSVTFLKEDATAVSITELEAGDRICCYPDQPGRHLGEKITEDITEW